MKTITIRCKGHVQGVFFRKSTEDKALEYHVKGWVRNEPNGDVLIRATGEKEALEKLIKWCHRGSVYANVKEVEVEEEKEVEDFDTFSITY